MTNNMTPNPPSKSSRLIVSSLIILSTLLLILITLSIVVYYIVFYEPPQPPEPTKTETPTLLVMLSQTEESTPEPTEPTEESTPEPTEPTEESTPEPTESTKEPTPEPVIGKVVTDFGLLNVRRGPGTCYAAIAQLKNGEEIIILRRTPARDWLEIELPNGKIGYVSEQFIDEISVNLGGIEEVVDLEPCPTPLITISNVDPPIASVLKRFNPRGDAIFQDMEPNLQQWYAFEASDSEPIVVVLMFTPNLNVGSRPIEFFLHDRDRINIDWVPGQPIPNELPGVTQDLIQFGAGSYPGRDLDGDLNTGELIWASGGLVPGNRYYLRVVNRSEQSIKYCLAPSEVTTWTCPQN